jgi:phospholipase C
MSRVLAVFLAAGVATATPATFSGPIEHVVLLMLENRAFDHMCGFCKSLQNMQFSIFVYIFL